MTEAKKDQIGYMPEERGLYQEMKLEACLLYLGQMKGLSLSQAQQRVTSYLERFDLIQQRQQKVKALSRGMQQKAQIISTVLPHPELLIVDEPFSGLDPVNARLVKRLIQELRSAGTTVIMSTHMMHQVEELCDRILLINRGRNILYGELAQIRRTFSGQALTVRVEGEFPSLTGVKETAQRNGQRQLALLGETTPEDVLQQLASQRVRVAQFEIAAPTLDEIFVQAVTAQASIA
jgi:ABC-2 type transport system ATP-binding protein